MFGTQQRYTEMNPPGTISNRKKDNSDCCYRTARVKNKPDRENTEW